MIAELVPLDQTRVGLDLIEKGRKEGEKKGREEARRAIAQRLFESGHSARQISELCQIPIEEVRQSLRNVS